MGLRILLALAVSLASAGVARAQVERDDARARLRATREWYGSTRGRARLLSEAARERDRYGIRNRQAVAAQAPSGAVAPGSFINLGPASADFSVNGDRSEGNIDSGRVRQVLAHPVDPDVLYLATSGGGVWKTWNARSPAIEWEPLTDALGALAVGTLAMDPAEPDILYLGFGDPFDVRQPGIVRSADGGGTWSAPVTLTAHYDVGGDARDLIAGTVTDLKVSPDSSLVVLATTDVGLFRSVDAGASWTQVSVPAETAPFFWMWSLASLGNGSWLLAGQEADITLPTDPAGGGALVLWRSTDEGATWTVATGAVPRGDQGGRVTLAVAPSTLGDPATARVYLLAANAPGSAQLDLYRSDDGGRSFQSLQVNGSRKPLNPNPDLDTLDVLARQAWYNQALLVDPQDPDLVFVGGQLALVRSRDGGRSWDVLSDWLPNNSENHNIDRPYVHADLHALAVGADRSFYAGSDGGLFVSGNALDEAAAAVTFDSTRNVGIVTHLAYTVACAPGSWPDDLQGFVAGGLQDNGTRMRDGKTTTFNEVVGGDGFGIAVSAGTHLDPATQANVPDLVLASAEFTIMRSTDGQTFAPFLTGMRGELPFFVQIVRDAKDPAGTFLTFTGQPAAFYRWAPGELSWTNASGRLHWQDVGRDTTGFVTPDGKSSISLRNLTAHGSVRGVWGAVSNRYAYATANAGQNWLVSLQPNPVAAPGGAWKLSSIELDRRDSSGRTYWVTSLADTVIDDASKLYPMPKGFGHVFQTRDGGLTWTSVGAVGPGALPDVGADVIRQDPGDAATLYVGTELGLYRSVDGGATWARFGAGSLPLVEVRDLCIAPQGERLTVATYGRGFWQIDTGAAASASGVRGLGDTNFDGRVDGEDLIDFADAFGSAQSSPAYRWQADLIGAVNAIDQADLDALLAKFGGRP